MKKANLGGRTNEPALVVDHLTKRFGDRVAYEDVSFQVGYGEVFGFLGPNGAGKTTTVRTLGTLIAPTSGSAAVAGIPLSDLCRALSKGLRQRVALARTLLSDPVVLFLDEPTSGLDPVASREVHELIGALKDRGVTIFLTTHRLEEAERLCDRVAIHNTTLRLVGRPEELRVQLFKERLEVRLGAEIADPASVFGGVTGVGAWEASTSTSYRLTVSDPDAAAPDVARALVHAGADILSITESRHSLEDVYLELVDEDVEAKKR
jgi:ABC-type multidrug transport system ATPase subunit